MKKRWFSRSNFINSVRGQITIFVIIALILIGGIITYFLIKNNQVEQVNPLFDNAYNFYISCIDSSAKTGASILGRQGGYIAVPDFEPGSEYSPFSSQLEFLGTNIPYWYYVSGNGIKKEQIPTQKQMEEQLSSYIQEDIVNCDLSEFQQAGMEIVLGEASVDAVIENNKITIHINQKLILSDNATTKVIENHNSEVSSGLGNLYKLSKNLYDYENQNLFLENYAKDTLYIYSPVIGTELSCSPKIWASSEVFDKLGKALEANIQLIKIKGKYYTLQDSKRGYFVVDPGFDIGDNQINFMYSKDWTTKFEVWPSNNGLMMANPVGTQEGLGIMGFCYVPYKFVYDVYIPVLVQVFNKDNSEVFQFPVGVVINKNNPREPAEGESEMTETICDKANTNISVYTYNQNLTPISANIEFQCFSDKCSLGKTKIDNSSSSNDSFLNVVVPTCVNGILIANAEGYKETKQIISTTEESSADIVLNKEYKLGLQIYVDNVLSNEFSVFSLSEIMPDKNETDYYSAVAYPNSKEINIAEGYYRFDLKVYKSGTITLPEVTKQQCTNVPKTGILGIFGMEEEKCYDINIPSQKVTSLVYAGGNTQNYLTSDMLEKARVMKVYATSIKIPTNLDELQATYDAIEIKNIEITL